MLYPDDFEHKIDFIAVRAALMQLCSFSLGKEEVDRLAFLTDYTLVNRLLHETQEMVNVLSDSSLPCPRCEMHDMRESLARVRVEGLFLDEQELYLLRKSLDAAVQYSTFFASLPAERFPWLSSPAFQEQASAPSDADTDSLSDSSGAPDTRILPSLLASIDRIIDKYGRMKDNASPELARIRHELQLAQGSASRALASILKQAQADGLIDRDVTPTMREGRLVIPVPPMHKRRIGGIVHDESATGKTVYIEPQQVVEANNRIRELESDERRERTRILLAFTAELRPAVPQVRASQRFLGRIDFLLAKAAYARQTNAIAPELCDDAFIDWREARHPVLEARLKKQDKAVVPLTIRLGNAKKQGMTKTETSAGARILVISGPNAGGKSVCLKTVALLQYMLQCGLLIPMREDSCCGLFRNLFIDIGDEQSIDDDLSTYSSHLRNMKHFLRFSDPQTLLLIDEFGSGTEPRIGGAIAEAVLQRLNEREAFGVITTHYDNLKHLAEDTPGIVNGAMLYDRGRLQPLFQLSIGQAGSSFAVEIAQQTGLPADIIDQAKALAGEEHIDYERHLQDIARDKRYWADKRQKVHQLEKQLEERIARYDEQMGTIKEKRREILADARQKAEDMLSRSNATIENTIRQIKEAAADKEATRSARSGLERFKQELAAAGMPPATEKSRKQHDKNTAKTRQQNGSRPSLPTAGAAQFIREQPHFAIGDRVRKQGAPLVGEIVALTDKQALVAFGAIQSYIPLRLLEYVSARQAKQQAAEAHKQQTRVFVPTNVSESIRKKSLTFSRELDLRGMRADEALTELTTYIDDAVMVGADEVRILHGTGTGALRQLTRDYLAMQRHVSDYHDAHPDHGGPGITVVTLA